MRYTLDTNFMSAIINQNHGCIQRLARAIHEKHEITLNPIAYFESKRGLMKPQYAKKLVELERMGNTYPMLSVNKDVADTAAKIQSDLEQAGMTIHEMDTLIAATAITHQAIVITRNIKHFARVPRIRFENWEDEVV